MQMLLDMRSLHSSVLLKYFKPLDIVAFDAGSRASNSFCRGPTTSKLIVPVFMYRRQWAQHLDLASVEALFADDMKLTSMRDNERFAGWLAMCAGLREMYCAHNGNLIVQMFAKALINLRNLTVLDLSHNHMASDSRSEFRRDQPLGPLFSSLPPQLRLLDLSYNLLRDDHMTLLVESLESSFANGGRCLEQLVVRSNYLGNGSGFQFANYLKSLAGAHLWRLDLRTNQVEATGACAMLGALPAHPSMREMRVGYNRNNTKQDLETAKVAFFLLQKALSVKSSNCLDMLDLNNVRIGDEGITQMAMALRSNKQLTRLDIAFNSIGPDGARALASALKSNQRLEHLDLRDNDVEDDGAEALARGLQKNGSMKRLLVARNGVTTRGAAAFGVAMKANPRLTVDFGASGASTTQLHSLMRRTPRIGINWWS